MRKDRKTMTIQVDTSKTTDEKIDEMYIDHVREKEKKAIRELSKTKEKQIQKTVRFDDEEERNQVDELAKKYDMSTAKYMKQTLLTDFRQEIINLNAKIEKLEKENKRKQTRIKNLEASKPKPKPKTKSKQNKKQDN